MVEVETHDLDSILDECLGAGIPNVELTWHYRSRHESLIAFSNQAYYGGRLVTFPSPVTRDDAVFFRHVPDGVYAQGGARTNERRPRPWSRKRWPSCMDRKLDHWTSLRSTPSSRR